MRSSRDLDSARSGRPGRKLPILLFDVMGTVCHDPFYREVPEFFRMSFEELLAVKDPTAWLEFEHGHIPEEEFLARFFQDGRAFDHEGLKEVMAASYRFLEGMEELLSRLAGKGFEIHWFSNYTCWYELIEERLRLSRFGAWSLVSCNLGVRKPDRRAFECAARALGVPAAQALFIDDRPQNSTAASAFGMDAIRFQDHRALAEELRRRGLL